MFEPYYLQLRGVAALTEPSPFALGAFIATGSLKLLEAATTTARSATAGAKCAKCKSAAGELRACSFCKAGIYHDTPACLGEQRGPEPSFKRTRASPGAAQSASKRGRRHYQAPRCACAGPDQEAQPALSLADPSHRVGRPSAARADSALREH